MNQSILKVSAAAFGVIITVSGFSQNLTVRTMAGATTPGATNGFASSARFNHPAGVAADNNGNIYVADTENSSVRKISPSGFVSTFAGLSGSFGSADGSGGSARFFAPQGVAADAFGQVYVADTANGTIRRVTTGGTVSTLAGTPGVSNSFDGTGINGQFWHPEGVTVGPDGNVYIADTWNHTIRKMTPGGVVTTVAGLAGYSGSADGTNSKARFNRPTGLVADSSTNIYVTDFFNHTIRKISAAGQVSTIAGLPAVWGSADGTNLAARFYLPQGITLSASGDLFVADSGNQTLRKISVSGTNWVVTTVAGFAGTAGATNGNGTTVRFDFPSEVASDSSGYLYLADLANNMVRTTRVVPPTLQSVVSANQLILSWPTSSEGFILQQATNLGPSSIWSPINTGIFASGDNFVRTNSLAGIAYYRLHLP
jgi:sugar lactone lactonase YvrE